MKIPMDIQVVDPSMNYVPCKKCGKNLADAANFKFAGRFENFPDSRREYDTCRMCKTIFAIEYRFFDEKGHISKIVFSGDVNDPKWDFVSLLTDEQKRHVETHLSSCQVCQARRDEELLTDAWLSDVLNQMREKSKGSHSIKS